MYSYIWLYFAVGLIVSSIDLYIAIHYPKYTGSAVLKESTGAAQVFTTVMCVVFWPLLLGCMISEAVRMGLSSIISGRKKE